MSVISSDLLPVFNALPGACLLLSPELIIEAASEAYLTVTLTQRANVVGKYVFDVFPDNPNSLATAAQQTVQASLHQVLATGQPHELTLQPYDLPDPAQPGHFVERYWRTRNVPVLDAQGHVARAPVALHKVARLRGVGQV
ncbi:MAG: protein phosphatase, partial [Hymenobacter sp.]